MAQLFSYPIYYGGSGVTDLITILNLINNLSPTFQYSSASLPQVNNQNIVIFKGTNWNFNVSGIGSDADNFYVTLKTNKNLLDSQSELQLSKSGILIVDGTSYTAIPSGQLTYSSGNSGTINVSVEPEVTSIIGAGLKYFWDLKGINESTIRAFGSIDIREDVTNIYS